MSSKIYVIGESKGDPKMSNKVEMLDVSKGNAWQEVKCMPVALKWAQIVTTRGKIYVLGGTSDTVRLKTLYQYDPKVNQWQTLAQMSQERAHFGADAFGPNVFAVGGGDGSKTLGHCEAYSVEKNSWSSLAPLIKGRYAPGFVAVPNESRTGSRLYAIGGANGTTLFNTVETLDVPNSGYKQSTTWKTGPALAHSRRNPGVALLKNGGKRFIVVAGGYTGSDHMSSVEILDLNSASAVWTKLIAQLPTGQSGSLVAAGDGLYMIGGYQGTSRLSTVLRLQAPQGQKGTHEVSKWRWDNMPQLNNHSGIVDATVL